MRGVGYLLLLTATSCANLSSSQDAKFEVITEVKPDVCTVVTELGDTIALYYYMYINGSMMESSRDLNNGKPTQIVLGSESTLPGWNIGLLGMCVGEIRRLILPPEYGFGIYARGVINGKTVLVFTIELVDIRKTSPVTQNNTEPDVQAPKTSENKQEL
ncbi:hypothetical protein EMCRGX_G014784 [Ephydatia muelleri]